MNQKIKIPLSLFQASTPHHPNFFAEILPVSEGRAGEDWEPVLPPQKFSVCSLLCLSRLQTVR
jgi:hypothetical protein